MSPLNLFYYNGLLVVRVFGSPGDHERLKDASVRLQIWREATRRALAWGIR